ncbi:MAG: carboxylate-amine ligase [Proteobacteria bacterium]|nr:carboxylate-amine ligase [Pseudomonadota bacterium]
MPGGAPKFTVGIEEEYLIVDRETRALCTEPPAEMFDRCSKVLGNQVAHEFMKSQIEVNTTVARSIPEARAMLVDLRRTVAGIAADYGLAPIAASTHPFSSWAEQNHTPDARYDAIARDLQAVARRLLISGMHVHVGIDDDELRMDLMNQVRYFLPHLLALSTSSPFWQGRDTGLKSYRMSVWDEMPRTGLPNTFDSFAEFQRHVDVLVRAGIIEDGTKLWWDIRPSARFPTLQMRITDVCTKIDDAAAVAALYCCILRMLWRLKTKNQRWRQYAMMLVEENRWRAQRYGLDEGLIDFGKGEVVACADLVLELMALVSEDAAALGCGAEIGHLSEIVKNGTSAHRQLRTHQKALAGGAVPEAALAAVVDHLIAETVEF